MTNLDSRLSIALEFVRIGYGDIINDAPFRSLYFQTDTLTTTEAKTVLEIVPIYNSFEGVAVANAIERFRRRVSGWSVGRAGSPVLQIELASWTHQVEETPPRTSGTRISETELQGLIDELREVFVEHLDADAFEFTDDLQRTIQVWWD